MCTPCYALYAGNGIGDTGAIAMGAALEKNTTLIELNLDCMFCSVDIILCWRTSQSPYNFEWIPDVHAMLYVVQAMPLVKLARLRWVQLCRRTQLS